MKKIKFLFIAFGLFIFCFPSIAQETYKIGNTEYYYYQTYSTTGKPKVKRSEANKTKFLKSLGYDEIPYGFEIDHIIPLSEGGTDDPSNMQLLTKEQHARKTVRERANRSNSTYYTFPIYKSSSTYTTKPTFKSYTNINIIPSYNHNGKTIYTGKNGGKYYINSNGNKTYIKSNSKSNTYNYYYTPSYNSGSRTIHTGSRGGKYYINSNGNKTYIKN